MVSQLALKGRRLKRKELKSHLLDMTTPSYKGFSSSLNIALVPATSVKTLLTTHFGNLHRLKFSWALLPQLLPQSKHTRELLSKTPERPPCHLLSVSETQERSQVFITYLQRPSSQSGVKTAKLQIQPAYCHPHHLHLSSPRQLAA